MKNFISDYDGYFLDKSLLEINTDEPDYQSQSI